MPRPPTARRLDSLFDNRYRYDFIYPRGRSGETLRAYDTQNDDQPVVIKRPAPQDAPPIRAGQEVSILSEKRALERLSGHPALTELRHTGTFRVGGQAHQYIVMEMAQGQTLEAMTLELAAQGKRLPELEMLVICDGLLDLLQRAHDHKIINNDVDAKHVFWDRHRYQLKVIDWGNAVFLDSESAPPQINRATDILQIGELIYFVVSGGKRMEIGRVDPAFDLGDTVSTKLQAIINHASNPDLGQRYHEISPIRQDLAEVRRPLEKNRDLLLERVRSRLNAANSQEQFGQLRGLIAEAQESDPGYPPARELLAEVEHRLKELSIQSDLDAVRIYIESGSMSRAANLLEDLRARLDSEQPTLDFLIDLCEQLQGHAALPAGLSPALDALLKGDPQAAGRILVTTPEPRPEPHMQQLLLAERLTVLIPGVTLLQPHLARLETQYPSRAVRIATPAEPGIQALRQVYERAADALLNLEEGQPSPAARARAAAEDILELLEVVSQNVLSDATRAGNALWRAAAIDPGSTAFESLNQTLTAFHSILDDLRIFAPAADGSNIAAFMMHAQTQIKPYAEEVEDPAFQVIVTGVASAIAAWTHTIDFLALGGRRPAVELCKEAADGIRPLNAASARWFDDYARRIEEAPRVELLSPNAPLARALNEGWEAWERGKANDSKSAGERAAAAALTDGEKLAAKRLIELSDSLIAWLANESDTERADQIEDRVSSLFLPEEEAIRRKFSAQMPNPQIYLKAMGKGIVEPMQEASAAAIRILFLHYVLRGILALGQDKPDDANFWKEAALKTLTNARVHPAFQALDNAITRRQLILDAVKAINSVKRPADLAEARVAVRAPLAASQLEYADQALRSVDEALRRWPDGEFRAARQQLDNALENVANAEKMTSKDLSPFKGWLQDLADSADILQQARRTIEQAALVPADTPDPIVMEAQQKLVDLTRRDLGESFTAQLRQWRDTYSAIQAMYLDPLMPKAEKLAQFDGHFASLFIDRQPALPIFRHWQSVIRLLPDPKPIYAEQEKSQDADIDEPDAIFAEHDAAEQEIPLLVREDPSRKPRLPLVLIIGGIVVLLIAAAIAGLAIFNGRGNSNNVAGTLGAGATTSTQPAIVLSSNTTIPTITFAPTDTPTQPTDTPTATILPFTLTPIPTITRSVPTPTPIPPTPTNAPPTTPAPGVPTLQIGLQPGSPVPTIGTLPPPTVIPDAQKGDYDVLNALNKMESGRITWTKDWFGPVDEGWQLGTATLKAGSGPNIVRLGPDVLTTLFGGDAAKLVTRIDATLELSHYDPSLLPSGQVFFGIGLESVLTGQHATAQIMLVQDNVMDLGININGTFIHKTQLPITTLKIAAERNSDKTVSLYLDNRLIGTSNAAYASGTPLGIYMFTSTGGVVVTVKALAVRLD